MPHYKSATNEIYWYDTEAEHSEFTPGGLTLITDIEVGAIRASLIVPCTYQELRAAEYPSIPDQLDIIFHSGLDVWKLQIQSVKDKYPKQ